VSKRVLNPRFYDKLRSHNAHQTQCQWKMKQTRIKNQIDTHSLWEMLSQTAQRLPVFDGSCVAHVVFRHTDIPDYAYNCLNTQELSRTGRMSTKRLNQFLSARIALKFLGSSHLGDKNLSDWRDIITVQPSASPPACRVETYGAFRYCSVSHTSEFVFAALADSPIGVDIETPHASASQAKHLFLSEHEEELLDACLEPLLCCTRFWTIKEASAKLFGIPLIEAWRRIQIETTSQKESHMTYDKRPFCAVHAGLDRHILTMILNTDTEIGVDPC